MKVIPCSYKNCGNRRAHFAIPDEDRGVQMIEVDEDYEGNAYCSLTCAMLDGKMTATEQNGRKKPT